jgi:adenylate cyclase
MGPPRSARQRQVPRAMLPKVNGSAGVRAAERARSRPWSAVPCGMRELTVMFTDIVGFTRLAETSPPTLIARLLRRHFSLLARCIEDEAGRIDKVMGDGLIAVWDPPDAGVGCAPALRAALAIRAALQADNAARARRARPPVRLRIGLHVGPLVATSLGVAGRLGVALYGDTVNVAQRLEDAARRLEGEHDVAILASEAVVARAGPTCRFRHLGRLPVRGRREPVEAFAVLPVGE